MFEYYRQKKGRILLTFLVILLPVAAGLIMWQHLPAQIPTHFGINGQVDKWSGKAVAVFGLPLIVAGVQALCLLLTGMDPKRRNISWKLFGIVLWICPVVSVLCGALTYMAALQVPLNINLIMDFFAGFLFLVIGNYLPKCRQNYTMGIKLAWTLNDEANWAYTHRLAGKIWTAGGLIVILTAFLNMTWLLLPVLLVMVLVPMVASYRYYRLHNREE